MQVIGPAREDARVLSAARVYQEATEHHLAEPPLVAPAVAGGAA
jgi:hypothetical protein